MLFIPRLLSALKAGWSGGEVQGNVPSVPTLVEEADEHGPEGHAQGKRHEETTRGGKIGGGSAICEPDLRVPAGTQHVDPSIAGGSAPGSAFGYLE
jgi:hypothetical protein